MSVEQAKSLIPDALMERIEKLEVSIKRSVNELPKNKIAVFDLDNTLLEGDIGEAVFALLKINERRQSLTIDNKKIPFTWKDYQDLIRTRGKKEAYQRVVISQAGIPLSRIVEITRQVMTMDRTFLDLEGVRIPVPSANPLMKALVLFLKGMDYEIYVISASNHYSVQYVAEEFFGIPAAHVLGMKPVLWEDKHSGFILGNKIEGSITVGEGKAVAYRQFIGRVPPLLTAGDSTTDFQMLNLVDPKGLCIWIGNDENQYRFIKQQLNHPHTAYFLYRGV